MAKKPQCFYCGRFVRQDQKEICDPCALAEELLGEGLALAEDIAEDIRDESTGACWCPCPCTPCDSNGDCCGCHSTA